MLNFIKHACYRLKTEGVMQFLFRTGRWFVFKYLKIKKNIKIFFIKIFKTKNSYFVKSILGSKMILNLKDKGLSRDLALSNIREPYSTEAMMKEIEQGDVVVSIGANIGYYALLESRLVGKKGIIYAIEPVPRNFALLRKNITINNYKNIEAFNVGLSSKIGTQTMYITPHFNGCSMQKNDIHAYKIIQVKTTTLDEFLKDKKQPQFIRMDVEGYALEIFKGAENVLKQKGPLKIFIEIHPTIKKKAGVLELLSILKKNGFEVKISAWEPNHFLIREKGLAKMLFNFFCKKIKTDNLHEGYFKTSIKELMEKLPDIEGACHVIFEKK